MLIYHDIACQNGHILYSSARFNKQLELKKRHLVIISAIGSLLVIWKGEHVPVVSILEAIGPNLLSLIMNIIGLCSSDCHETKSVDKDTHTRY